MGRWVFHNSLTSPEGPCRTLGDTSERAVDAASSPRHGRLPARSRVDGQVSQQTAERFQVDAKTVLCGATNSSPKDQSVLHRPLVSAAPFTRPHLGRWSSRLSSSAGNLGAAPITSPRRPASPHYDGFIHLDSNHRTHGSLGWASPTGTLTRCAGDNLAAEHN